MGVDKLIPVRHFRKSPKPTITGEGVLRNSQDDIGVLDVFKNHSSKFGQKLFKQIWRAPTGLRLTGGAPKIRMIRFARKLLKILKRGSGYLNHLHLCRQYKDLFATTEGWDHFL